MTGINQILEHLHGLLRQHRDVSEQLAQGPRQIKAREQLASKAEQLLQAKRDELKQARAHADRRSLELKSNEAKLGDLRAKLNAASSNREYDLIQGHIEADTVANSVLEDEILEALETVDRLQIEAGESNKKLEQALEETERCRQRVAEAEGGLRQRATELADQIRQSETRLPGEILVQYRRLVDAYGADALAAVDGKICTHCYVAVTPQTRVAINSGKPMFCHCGRLLYAPASES